MLRILFKLTEIDLFKYKNKSELMDLVSGHHSIITFSIKSNETFFLICHRIFEKIRQYFGAQSESIPMSFVLGFYVSLVVKRWWEQYKLLPWPDTLALFISAAIPGNVNIDYSIKSVLFLFLFNLDISFDFSLL